MRKVVHYLMLLGISLMAALVMVDLAILVWSYFPVAEAALRMDASSVLFFIGPAAVGETSWTGWQVLVVGATLLLAGVELRWIRRSGRLSGLSGPGTGFLAGLAALAGVGFCAGGAYMAAVGELEVAVKVPAVLPSPIGLMALKFSLLTQWHGIMIGAILMSFVVMVLRDGREYRATARRAVSVGEVPPLRTDNAWMSVFRMYMAILAFYIVYDFVLGLFTVEPETPAFSDMQLWELLHAFAEASVWEEVLSRVLMLGLPLWLYHVYSGRNDRPLWRYLAGGGFKMDLGLFVLVLVQALVFALAHVAGWDLWKVLPTTVSGMAFGYLFVKRGLYASIMLHFTFDYLGMTVDTFAEWGLDIEIVFNVVFLYIVAAGFVLMVHYVVIIMKEGPTHIRTVLFGPREGTGGKVYRPRRPSEGRDG